MQNVTTKVKKEGEVQAIATLIEKQAQIMVKSRMVSEEEGQKKAALLAQYADVTDEEDEVNEKDDLWTSTANTGSDKSLFRNTSVEDVPSAWKLEQDSLQLQREDKLLSRSARRQERKGHGEGKARGNLSPRSSFHP